MIYQVISLDGTDGDFSDLRLSKRQTKAGRLLLSRMIREQYSKTDYTVTYNENGKPLLPFCCFSISHSADLVVCAVGDKPVGIDIEKREPVKKRKTYPLFSGKESEYVNGAEDSSLAFLTLWTRKEAVVKAEGGTLADMANFSLVNEDLSLKPTVKNLLLKTEITADYLISVAEYAGK